MRKPRALDSVQSLMKAPIPGDGLLRLCLTALLLTGAALTLPSGTAGAQSSAVPARQLAQSGLPLPRFVSLRADEVNLRIGPGIRYPIDWVYRRRGLPVEVIDEFETWRRVRDHDGTTGWVHQSMLTGQRSVLILSEDQVLRSAPEPEAPGVARLEAGVIARLESCPAAWCQLKVEGYAGWLPREAVFGLYPSEVLR